jgi:hypothetical protein
VIAGTACLASITAILRAFSDILPLASTDPQTIWRFEIAFLLTAARWIALAVEALYAISVIVPPWKSVGARAVAATRGRAASACARWRTVARSLRPAAGCAAGGSGSPG